MAPAVDPDRADGIARRVEENPSPVGADRVTVNRRGVIRLYRTTDLEELLVVWERASDLAHRFLPANFLAAERERIAEVYLPASETWIRQSGDRVAGFISLLGEEIGGLFVLPELGRRGIGRSLVDHARSIRETLEVEVFARNAIGRAFYASYGFVPIGRGVDEATGFEVIRLGLIEDRRGPDPQRDSRTGHGSAGGLSPGGGP